MKLTSGTKNDLPNSQNESTIKRCDEQHGQTLKCINDNCVHNNNKGQNNNANHSSDVRSLPGKWINLNEHREDEDINCSRDSISKKDKFPSEPMDLHHKSRLNGHSDENKSTLHSAGVATLAEVSVYNTIA